MKKTVFILGIDGYIGYPLARHLKEKGYDIIGLDCYFRRDSAQSLIPISKPKERRKEFPIIERQLDDLRKFPVCDAVIHLAEQPSASWSMQSVYSARETQYGNVIGTLSLLWFLKQLPKTHLIKLGSMGEYGTPNCDIPEGQIEKDCKQVWHGESSYFRPNCPMEGLPFPRQPNSFYHLSKVFDSQNIEFACRTWGLRATDIMQGVVFGHVDGTRFDYDEHFGTVINRFCAQAVAGVPLTVYGEGGQTRGFLPLKDSIECITLALENPAEGGEYRVFNQFAETYDIYELACMVEEVGNKLGLDVKIEHIDNPRTEQEKHYFNPKHDKLRELGYKPDWDIELEIEDLITAILPYKDDINKEIIQPKTKWGN
ncbi:MAG: NAD-dependent epimerase/dehydratase family protein [bacterium]|nr:NAD-dependent epimerase/dehydratase family protein [bacterium]